MTNNIVEYLQLGDSFFTYMTAFGILNKQNGEMLMHFHKRGVISCIFFIDKVTKGGENVYFNGDKLDISGEILYNVPFVHDTLQIVFQ